MRPYNFSAGPAAIPEEVLQQAAAEMLDWHGSGMGVMEMSHRGKEFISIYTQAEADLRELLAIPANYKVLFLQGGASSCWPCRRNFAFCSCKAAGWLKTPSCR